MALTRGFAEADPTLDLDGHDAAQKIRILARPGVRPRAGHARKSVIGIRSVTRRSHRPHAHAGKACVIRLVAEAEPAVPGGVTVRVRPQEFDAG